MEVSGGELPECNGDDVDAQSKAATDRQEHGIDAHHQSFWVEHSNN